MATERLTDPASPTPAQRGRRAAVLQVLRASDEPLGAAEVAERVGAHLNTARFHLDALVADGRAARDTVPRTERGRPKVVYTSVDGARSGDSRSFRLLAEILTGIVAASVPDPAAAALEAGRAWGVRLTDSPAPGERIDADEAQRRIIAGLDRMGFVPDADEEGDTRQLRLHHCPFREAAQERSEIVCTIHLGLMRGAVARLDAPLVVEDLTPFVRPHLCVATLHRTRG
ncbi:metalloregulator ArsR/SmtB family transcription factor [Planomonospora sp. ID82291]|uniref:helix-turn-helix transcriptional regulator n=1 Tax=Planomonospora sp. ID82291 TaxID=2738136 RepID=UPI0018C35983|nr:helix-turn-helix domain-containing protein [Planomonospora sp. ID82291]MBG0814302.1 ArsR family transcriptional regulator [Planomonospora sp. ID82291]